MFFIGFNCMCLNMYSKCSNIIKKEINALWENTIIDEDIVNVAIL